MSKSKKRIFQGPPNPDHYKRPKLDLTTTTPTPQVIQAAFENFASSLSFLLSPAVPASTLPSLLGDEQSRFLSALSEMRAAGDLSFLPPPSEPTSKTWPPAIPSLAPALRQQAFTHRSWIDGEKAGLPGTENKHYERLEYLGDAHLQSVATQILYSRFPTVREGTLSSMRQVLVCNSTLYGYSQLYNMGRYLREGKGQDTTKHKTLADCFEAYIGGIIVERGVIEGTKTLHQWLGELWEPKLRELESGQTDKGPVDKMAKQSLSVVCGPGAKLEYVWTEGGGGNRGGFCMTVHLNGYGRQKWVLGKGWGESKGEAQLRAAMNALKDKKLCDEIIEVKERHIGPKRPKEPSGDADTKEEEIRKAESKNQGDAVLEYWKYHR